MAPLSRLSTRQSLSQTQGRRPEGSHWRHAVTLITIICATGVLSLQLGFLRKLNFSNDLSSYYYGGNITANNNDGTGKSNDSDNESFLNAPIPKQSIESLRNTHLDQRRRIDHRLHDMNPPLGAHEAILTFAIGQFFREDQSGILSLFPPEGSFLDVGCQFGEQAAHYAVVAPEREVIAMDPSPENLEKVRQEFGSLENLVIRQGGVGREVGSVVVDDPGFHLEMGSEFPVVSVDSMFFDQGKKLAFAHFDVEGLELEVLKGATKTIRDSNPIFTTEVRVHKYKEYTNALLQFIFDLGYDSYVINEACGYPHMDYRNLLNVPRKLSADVLKKSDTFLLLHATNSVFRTPVPKEQNTKTIFDLVLPCCALGGECCPGTDINSSDCCSEKRVLEWLDKNRPEANIYNYGWKNARKEFDTLSYRLNQRRKIH